MRDTYESMRSDLEGYQKAFPAEGGQQGLLVSVNGAPIAFDILLRADAYRQPLSRPHKQVAVILPGGSISARRAQASRRPSTCRVPR